MAEYRLDSIGSLARQMGFTPHKTLATQITAAEALLHDIDPAKAYPIEFIIHRITGYRPKKFAGDLLTGLALQHDLGLLIEQASETLQVPTSSLSEVVLSIDDVTERFNVTSKTIQRWRRRGLPARRFIFPDGKCRVGFLLSSVERFFAAHREQVPRETNLTELSAAERDLIIRRALVLAREGGCWESEIARRIGRKLNRSPAIVLHTVRRHDQDHPEQAILHWAPIPVPQEDNAKILRAYRHGISIKSLAEKYHQSRSAIYRVIMDERIARLNRRKVKFIDDELYHQDDAENVMQQMVSQEELGPSRSKEELRIPRDLPAYLQELYRTPLLSANRERALFLKFNFHKYQFIQARRELEPQFARSRDLDVLENHRREACEMKNQIIRANLRLVVSVARKHLRPNLNLMELISDGNITLMRAVEGFDPHKGNRFSTYATLALMKGFARSVPMMRAACGLAQTDLLGEVADHRNASIADRLVERDHVRQLLTRLDESERTVLEAHYGLDDSACPASYEEVGQRLGLSKHRVRQIEQNALAKLREESTHF
ncbi:MAG TPA: sigma-70 family RNA polymerase sigma factor [Tepidisphaeraceae bacterium]|nr:sigma-70 family RNA polymerase sigma factor [Tepidisphaeraceae bacterium]